MSVDATAGGCAHAARAVLSVHGEQTIRGAPIQPVASFVGASVVGIEHGDRLPVAALAVVLLSFVTYSPNPVSIVLFAIALVPWVFVGAGARIPALVVVMSNLVVVSIVVTRYDDQPALFLAVVTIGWTSAQGLRWHSVLGLVGGAFAAVRYSWMHDDPGHRSGWGMWVTGLFMGCFLGELLYRQRRLTAELSAARHELSMVAVADARTRIAREVHDIVGHSLTVVLLNITGARRQLANDPDAADAALRQAESISRESLDSVRTVIGLLSDGTSGQTDAPLPCGADVVPTIEQARRSGMTIDPTVRGDPNELEPAIGLTLVRLLQEALANAHRHAPGSPIDLTLDIDERTVSVLIANDIPTTGVGIVPNMRAGLGVPSMIDRVGAVGGSIEIGPSDGSWEIHCVLPRSVHRNLGLRSTR